MLEKNNYNEYSYTETKYRHLYKGDVIQHKGSWGWVVTYTNFYDLSFKTYKKNKVTGETYYPYSLDFYSPILERFKYFPEEWEDLEVFSYRGIDNLSEKDKGCKGIIKLTHQETQKTDSIYLETIDDFNKELCVLKSK